MGRIQVSHHENQHQSHVSIGDPPLLILVKLSYPEDLYLHHDVLQTFLPDTLKMSYHSPCDLAEGSYERYTHF